MALGKLRTMETAYLRNEALLRDMRLPMVGLKTMATAYIRNMRYAIAIVLSSPIAVELYSIKELLGSK